MIKHINLCHWLIFQEAGTCFPLFVPKRMGGESTAISKIRLSYLWFYFWFNMSSTMSSLCKKIFWINQTVLKMWLSKKSKFRIFAGCSWFPLLFGHSRCSFMHLCPPAGFAKISITDRSLIQLRGHNWLHFCFPLW